MKCLDRLKNGNLKKISHTKNNKTIGFQPSYCHVIKKEGIALGYILENRTVIVDFLKEQLYLYPQIDKRISDHKNEIIRHDRTLRDTPRGQRKSNGFQEIAISKWDNDQFLQRQIKIKNDATQLIDILEPIERIMLKEIFFKKVYWRDCFKSLNLDEKTGGNIYWSLLDKYAELEKVWIKADKQSRANREVD